MVHMLLLLGCGMPHGLGKVQQCTMTEDAVVLAVVTAGSDFSLVLQDVLHC